MLALKAEEEVTNQGMWKTLETGSDLFSSLDLQHGLQSILGLSELCDFG